MRRTLQIGNIDIFTDGEYCNTCLFKKYVNNEIKYTCLLFGKKIKRDGNNFIRLEKCKEREIKNEM